MILAIDPGPEESAVVIYDPNAENNEIYAKFKPPNHRMIEAIEMWAKDGRENHCAIEMVACYGMPVGEEVFHTCLWVGRFSQVWIQAKPKIKGPKLIYRKDIKMHFCQSMRAKDSNIRQALIDRFGKPGTKKQPGKTYGIAGDMWSALAVAVYYADKY